MHEPVLMDAGEAVGDLAGDVDRVVRREGVRGPCRLASVSPSRYSMTR